LSQADPFNGAQASGADAALARLERNMELFTIAFQELVELLAAEEAPLPPARPIPALRSNRYLRHRALVRFSVITGGIAAFLAGTAYLPPQNPVRIVVERTVNVLVERLPDPPPININFVPPSNGPLMEGGQATWVSVPKPGSSVSAQTVAATSDTPGPSPSELAVTNGQLPQVTSNPSEPPSQLDVVATSAPDPPLLAASPPPASANAASLAVATPVPTPAPAPTSTEAPTPVPTPPPSDLPTPVPADLPTPTPKDKGKDKATPTPVPSPTSLPTEPAPSPSGVGSSPSPEPSSSP
jgi:hypothetical protein